MRLPYRGPSLQCQWVLQGVSPDPCQKPQPFEPSVPYGELDPMDPRSLTAVFCYEARTSDGALVDYPKVRLPDMVALTKQDIEDGTRAYIHQIPKALVQEGFDLLEAKQRELAARRARLTQQEEPIQKITFEPKVA